ncbi:MAG: TolB family protein, partial [bacterium]
MTERANLQSPVTSEDLLRVQVVTDTQVSPDGTWVVFALTRLDATNDALVSNLWLVRADGSSTAKQLTFGESRDRSPRWMSNGSQLA